MNILLNLNEKPYEDALLRGLGEISAGVCVNSAPDEDGISSADVIITDDESIYNENHDKSLLIIPASFINNEMCAAKERVIDPTATVSEIYKRSVSLFEELTGCIYCSGLPGTAVSINFEGICGGTGATSAAITLGRLLIAKRSKRVVYVTDNDGSFFEPYINYVETFLRPVSELEYYLSKDTNYTGHSISIRNYMAMDEFGLNIVKSCNNIGETIKLLNRTNEFDYIITDVRGLRGYVPDDGLKIKVYSQKDMRCRVKFNDIRPSIFTAGKLLNYESPQELKGDVKEINLYNCAEFSSFNGNNMYIAFDDESFEKKGSKVIISLSSVFASGLMPLLDLLERKNSDGWN